MSAQQAKQLLVEGNKRFVSGEIGQKELGAGRRIDLFENGQFPFAVVLTCSDSRVPPELLFDQGLGQLFVVRVAGNVVDPVALGSIEYGAEHLGAPLLVVLGHSNCGAVKASVDGGEAPGSIGALVAKIKPSVDKMKAAGASGANLYEKVEDENVRAVIAEIGESPVVQHLVQHGHLEVVGAKYLLDSGEVVFF
ncbi:MAG TPA: carbonic anhydrase [Syntrophomonadaceae bacterium]|nr:carbonic anhydrase [Syntrophomonadaceae bacterium]